MCGVVWCLRWKFKLPRLFTFPCKYPFIPGLFSTYSYFSLFFLEFTVNLYFSLTFYDVNIFFIFFFFSFVCIWYLCRCVGFWYFYCNFLTNFYILLYFKFSRKNKTTSLTFSLFWLVVAVVEWICLADFHDNNAQHRRCWRLQLRCLIFLTFSYTIGPLQRIGRCIKVLNAAAHRVCDGQQIYAVEVRTSQDEVTSETVNPSVINSVVNVELVHKQLTTRMIMMWWPSLKVTAYDVPPTEIKPVSVDAVALVLIPASCSSPSCLFIYFTLILFRWIFIFREFTRVSFLCRVIFLA